MEPNTHAHILRLRVMDRQLVTSGVHDKRNRRIGFRFEIQRMVVRPRQDGDTTWRHMDFPVDRPTTVFVTKVRATRSGSDFGPGLVERDFPTFEEAEAWGRAEAQKRCDKAAKKFAADL